MKKPQPVTLVTNLEYVLINGTGVRTMTHAMVIHPPDPDDQLANARGGPRAKIRGFGYNHTNPTFDMHIPSSEYVAVAAESIHMRVLKDDGTSTPLALGQVWTFKDGPTLQLQRHTDPDDNRGIHVETFEDDDHSTLYRRLWHTLDERIGEFWPRDGMPVIVWSHKAKAIDIRRQVNREMW